MKADTVLEISGGLEECYGALRRRFPAGLPADIQEPFLRALLALWKGNHEDTLGLDTVLTDDMMKLPGIRSIGDRSLSSCRGAWN